MVGEGKPPGGRAAQSKRKRESKVMPSGADSLDSHGPLFSDPAWLAEFDLEREISVIDHELEEALFGRQ